MSKNSSSNTGKSKKSNSSKSNNNSNNDSDQSMRKLLVTMALPYANGDIHMGHLVEAVQTDIYVRFQKLCNRPVTFVCADDTHGTPIELNALRRGISPQSLIDEAWLRHVADYKDFSIEFDQYYTTNSPENQRWSEHIYQKLRHHDLINEQEIEQFFCEHCKRFLPDRFITGVCPKCAAEKQYGDVCEVCGATYDPVDLKEPACIICQTKPVRKKSTHFFVKLEQAESFLRSFLSDKKVVQEDMKNFVMHWIEDGLRQWCISRDGPYFGFPIPGTTNKYFYVWLDAPVGYIASTEKWCSSHAENVLNYWGKEADCDIVHVIGKDIVYFHTLFWPVMLWAADLKLPSRYIVHGFLTINGEKMSKSRGTALTARDYREKIKHPCAPQYLRFYYGSKLTNSAADIDLNTTEFCTRINTILVNNFGNLHYRTFVFLDRYYNSTVPQASWDSAVAETVEEAAGHIRRHFEAGEFKNIIERIQALGTMGNKYYQDNKVWELIKSDPTKAATVMVTCVNLVKAIGVFLKPFVPGLVASLERHFGMTFTWKDVSFSLVGHTMGAIEKIVTPLEESDFISLITPTGQEPIDQSAESGGAKTEQPSQPDKKQAQKSLSAPVNTPVLTKEPVAVESIDITDFKKVRLQVGQVVHAESIPGSQKLCLLTVDDGSTQRRIVAGIAKQYTPEQLLGRKIVFVANLKPVKIMGYLSEGMVLAAKHKDGLSLVQPDADVAQGAVVS
ncbi:MAG: methionine--tRNA ligase [Chitinivibrionales bacterium]|nr:methionine--tRNA ligase [Chitinivibrionales bacterium]